MQYNGIIIMGPPGAGKDTQAEMLTQIDISPGKFYHYNSGNEFRAAEQGTDIGAKIEQGHYGPDDRAITLFTYRMNELVQSEQLLPWDKIVLNGIPRTLAQVKMLGKYVEVEKVLRLILGYRECEARLIKRGRSDDTPEAISLRHSTFRDETYTLSDEYDSGLVTAICAGRTREEVHEHIKEVLGL